MKERDFLKALNSLGEQDMKELDVYPNVAIAIGRRKLIRVILTSALIFPFSTFALFELLRLQAVRNTFSLLFSMFNIDFNLALWNPFLGAILTILCVSFTFSFVMSFIIQGGIKDEMLLSSR
ncbi:MAG: hypothetical protein ACP5SB_02605 [Caldisericaceae bacterium]